MADLIRIGAYLATIVLGFILAFRTYKLDSKRRDIVPYILSVTALLIILYSNVIVVHLLKTGYLDKPTTQPIREAQKLLATPAILAVAISATWLMIKWRKH